MFEFLNWWHSATLDEILLGLFVVVGFAFIRVILFTGRNIALSTNEAITSIATRLDKLDNTFGCKINKLDDTLNHMTQVMMEFKLEVHDEIAKIERRVSLTENDIGHVSSELARTERRNQQ